MSTQVQYRRGTATQNNGFVGALAEITIDTTNKTIRVHDGATAGGSNIATVAYVDNAIGSLSANAIVNGTTTVDIGGADANVTVSVNGTSNVMVVSSTGANVSGTLGVTGNITGGNLSGTGITGTLLTASQTNITGVGTISTGTWQANSISTTYTDAKVTSVNASTGISVNATTGAVTVTNTGVTSAVAGTGVSVSGATGAVTFSIGQAVGTGASPTFAGITLPSITKNGSNGVGNIGQSNNTFNTVFARATSALYADLAELYTADAKYAPGTVLVFGGTAEVTESTQSHCTRIAGVVSTEPAHIMNSALTAEHVAAVALVGRVPCRVVGQIQPGDCLVSSDIPGVATAMDAVKYQPGAVIGKALENYNSTEPGVIEAVVGRL